LEKRKRLKEKLSLKLGARVVVASRGSTRFYPDRKEKSFLVMGIFGD
jgi:hypothetical protein